MVNSLVIKDNYVGNLRSLLEKYGFLVLCLWCYSLILPDLTSKTLLMDTNLDLFNQSISDSNSTKQIFWIAFFLLYWCVFISDFIQGKVDKSIGVALGFFAVVILLCATSVMWSQEVSFTVKRLIFQLILCSTWIFSVYYANKRGTFRSNVRIIAAIFFVVGLISILLGTGYWSSAFSGWAKNKNMMGLYCFSLLCLFYLSADKNDEHVKFDQYAIIGLFFMIVFSQSKTCLALALILAASHYFRVYVNHYISAFYIVLISTVFFFIPLVSYWMGGDFNISYYMEDETLTGRGFIWNSLYYDLFNFGKMLSGYGYGAYFSIGYSPFILDDAYSFSRFINSAHNSYLGLLLQLGAVVSSFIILLFCFVCYVIRNKLIVTIIMLLMTYGITESFLIRDQHVAWITLIIVITYGIIVRGSEGNESSNYS